MFNDLLKVYKKEDDKIKLVWVGYLKPHKTMREQLCGKEEDLPVTFQGEPLTVENCIISCDSGTFVIDGEDVCRVDVDLSDAEDMKGSLVVCAEPNLPAYVTRLRSDLKSLQRAVSDHREPSLIEYAYLGYNDDCYILCNEEGKLIGLPFNRSLCGQNFVGTIYVLTDDGYGNLKDLSYEEIAWYTSFLDENIKK